MIMTDNIPIAEKELGLILVGTIVSDNAVLRRAIIDNRRMRQQEAYREGEIIGQVQIKKILQGKIIIRTEVGDKLLAVTYENSRLKSIDEEEESFEELYTAKRRSYQRRNPNRVRHLERDDD